jgi:hypothetical protein
MSWKFLLVLELFDFALNASVNWKLLLFSPMSMFEGNLPFSLVNVLTFRRTASLLVHRLLYKHPTKIQNISWA